MIVLEKISKCERAWRYCTCHSRNKKELFSIRTTLSCHKVLHRKCISHRNEKIKENRNTDG